MQNYEPKVVSTFSGAGGSSLGYKLAGCKVLCAVDMVSKASDTYALNFPDTPIIKKDIRQVTGAEILGLIGLKVGELDILDGSPPCASYSSIGKGKKNWNKPHKYSGSYMQRTDDLIDQQIRLIREIQPKCFVMENVKGMTRGMAKDVLNNYLIKLTHAGYEVRAEVLDASYFECATKRERLFIIGFRKDLKISPSLPKPISKRISFRDATAGLKIPKDEIDEAVLHGAKMGKMIEVIETIRPYKDGSDHDKNGNFWSYKSAISEMPLMTLTTHIELRHPTKKRFLTISELKACSSLPMDFKLIGSYANRWERIGRMVPPNLMKHIAKHVSSLLLSSKITSKI